MKPIKVKQSSNTHEEKVMKNLAKLKNLYPYSYVGLPQLFKTKDRFVNIGSGTTEDGQPKETRLYVFSSRDYSELNARLSEIAIREERMKEQGYNLDGIKSFNRNTMLDFSKESNAIEGIFDDFNESLLDFRIKLRGSIDSEPKQQIFDKHEYYKFMIEQCDKAVADNNCRVVRGRKFEHQLSPELIRHFLALKYAYKCAKLDKCLRCRQADNRDLYKLMGLSKQETEKRLAEDDKARLDSRKAEFFDMILKTHSFLFDAHSMGFRSLPARVDGSGWTPPSVEQYPEFLDNLVDFTVDEKKSGQLHPIEKAAIFHADFIHTHPFYDGNGRTGRILSNYLLIQNEMPTISISHKDRPAYFKALNKTVLTNDIDDLIDLFYNSLLTSVKGIESCLDSIEKAGDKTKVGTK